MSRRRYTPEQIIEKVVEAEVAYTCYAPKLITEPKTSPYSEYICSWGPAPQLSRSFIGFLLAPRLWG
jgi:hypothetical protein